MSQDTILHIGDTHLRDSASGSLSRGPDFAAAFEWCVQHAINKKMKAVLHGGDLLHHNKPSSRNITDLLRIHALAAEAEMPVYVVTGNHDMIKPSWVEVIEEAFGQSGFGLVCADNRRINIPQSELTLQGLPFLSRDDLKKALAEIPPADILLWHGMVKEFVSYPQDNCVELADFPVDKFRLIALGDIHQHNYMLLPDGTTIIGYPGSTELCDRGEDLEKTVSVFKFTTTGGIMLPVDKPTKSVIPTRHVRVFNIASEEDLSRIIHELGTDPKIGQGQRPPLVFISYDPEVPGVVARIKNAAPAEAIVRYAALNSLKMDFSASGAAEDVAAGKALTELVRDFLVPGKLRDLAEQLTSPEAQAKELIQAYVNERLQAV